MPEIGEMLREARLRARIDIADIEAETKIRAKYLRALEAEEWGLLPGPAYVKSFLRTYADRLGLDGRLLVEQFKLRHEGPAEAYEQAPIRPPSRADRRRAGGAGGGGGVSGLPGWVVAGAVLVVLLIALYALGSRGSSHPTTTARSTSTTRHARPLAPGPAVTRRRRVALQLLPTGPVWVCLTNGAGKRLVNGVTLAPGTRQPTFKATRFLVTLGNGSLDMRIDGHLRTVPQVNNAIGYEITRAGRKVLATNLRPTCA